MNTNELHLKKKWDEEIHQVGVIKCFENVFHNDYKNMESWLRIYFNNLEFEDKCQIINYAGWNVITNLKGIVENHELISFSLYSWILTHDINNIYCEFSLKNKDIMQRLDDDKTCRDYEIQFLRDEVDRLNIEISQLKEEIRQLKNAQ